MSRGGVAWLGPWLGPWGRETGALHRRSHPCQAGAFIMPPPLERQRSSRQRQAVTDKPSGGETVSSHLPACCSCPTCLAAPPLSTAPRSQPTRAAPRCWHTGKRCQPDQGKGWGWGWESTPRLAPGCSGACGPEECGTRALSSPAARPCSPVARSCGTDPMEMVAALLLRGATHSVFYPHPLAIAIAIAVETHSTLLHPIAPNPT